MVDSLRPAAGLSAELDMAVAQLRTMVGEARVPARAAALSVAEALYGKGLYLVECECGGPHAAGGGCGAPTGLFRADALDYALTGEARRGREPQVLREVEIRSCGFDPEEVQGYLHAWQTCPGCRER